MIITLCGSTRFINQFNNANIWLTMRGIVVLSVGSFYHSDRDIQIRDIIMQNKHTLDILHKRKIAMSDSIMIIDVDNYIGDSTRSEIQFAELLNIPKWSYTRSIEMDSQLRTLVKYQ